MAPMPTPQVQQQHPMHGAALDPRTAPMGGQVGAPPQPPGKMSLKEQWEALSWPKKVAMVMLPLLLLYFIFAPNDDDRPAPKTAKKPSADAAALATAPASAPPSATQPAVPTLPVSALPTAAGGAPPPPPPSSSPLQRTLERQAVDLVASGQYERAAFVYDQLARQYPDRPVYRETARILRAKLDAGAP
jgi:hypothetical protein